PDPAFLEAIFGLDFPRRLLLLSPQPEREIPARLSSNGLAETARRLLTEIAKPEGVLYGRTAAADPLMAWPRQLERLATAQGAVRVLYGGYVAGHPPRAVLFVTTRASGFDAAQQTPLL